MEKHVSMIEITAAVDILLRPVQYAALLPKHIPSLVVLLESTRGDLVALHGQTGVSLHFL